MTDASAFFTENLLPWSFGIKEAAHQVAGVLNGKAIGYRAGWVNLDRMLRLVPGELTLIGARAGTGKTAFGMQLAENVMKQMIANGDEGLVVVFSAEMSASALAKRTACGLAGVPVWKVDNGEITKDEGARVLEQLRLLEAWPFVVDQTTSPTLEHMIQQIQVYAEEATIRLVLFDYMELAGEFAKEESQRVAKIGRGLHSLARKFNCPVVALSQLNRDIERRAKKKPMLSDLMHGGEREPDRVVMLVRPALLDEDADDKLVNVYVVKNRNAPQGETTLLFDAPNMRFQSAQVVRHELNGKAGVR